MNDISKLANMSVDHIKPKEKFNPKLELQHQAELIDELYNVVELVTYEKWVDVINEFKLNNSQGFLLTEKQMEYAEGIKSALIDKQIL